MFQSEPRGHCSLAGAGPRFLGPKPHNRQDCSYLYRSFTIMVASRRPSGTCRPGRGLTGAPFFRILGGPPAISTASLAVTHSRDPVRLRRRERLGRPATTGSSAWRLPRRRRRAVTWARGNGTVGTLHHWVGMGVGGYAGSWGGWGGAHLILGPRGSPTRAHACTVGECRWRAARADGLRAGEGASGSAPRFFWCSFLLARRRRPPRRPARRWAPTGAWVAGWLCGGGRVWRAGRWEGGGGRARSNRDCRGVRVVARRAVQIQVRWKRGGGGCAGGRLREDGGAWGGGGGGWAGRCLWRGSVCCRVPQPPIGAWGPPVWRAA